MESETAQLPFFKGFLDIMEVGELDFLSRTGATLKYGIRHQDWRRIGHSYDGPIDDPYLFAPAPTVANDMSWIDVNLVSRGPPVSSIHLFKRLMDTKRAPYRIEPKGRLLPISPHNHAYHFDQAKVGLFLRSLAEGIERVDAAVTEVHQDSESGDINALSLTNGTTHAADFVVDCTGFGRKLICETMGGRWMSYSAVLPVNRAIPFWLPHPRDDDIAPYTIA